MYRGMIPSVRHLLFKIVTALSLLVCVAAVGLWVRSYCYDDQISFSAADRCYGIHALRGRIGLSWTSRDPGWRTYSGGGWRHTPTSRLAPSQEGLDRQCGRRLFGFGVDAFVFSPGITTGPQTNHVAVVPHWSLAAAALALPTYLVWSRRRMHRRQRLGLCPRCGYDLRATPGRCPECGAISG